MSKNTTINNIDLWNAIIVLDQTQKRQLLDIARGMANADNGVAEEAVEIFGLVMTRKVAPAVFSAIHHACKDGGATWDKSAKMWVFETKSARDKVLRAQKKYAKDNGFECVLANA